MLISRAIIPICSRIVAIAAVCAIFAAKSVDIQRQADSPAPANNALMAELH